MLATVIMSGSNRDNETSLGCFELPCVLFG